MKLSIPAAMFALVAMLTVGALVPMLAGSTGAPAVAAPANTRALHVTKECSQYNYLAGGFCTITSSSLGRIPAGSTITYDQAFGIPAGMLDSNVVLDAGNGDWAVGRCTVVGATGRGVCTFSDGAGTLAHFDARVDVSTLDGLSWTWEGTYSFDKERDGHR